MRKKSLIILAAIVLVGIVSILALTQNRPAERIVVDNLNKAISNYTDMNIKDEKAYSLKVSDVQILITTYTPEYTLFGVSTDEYTARPSQINEAMTSENEQDFPMCDYEYMLLYDEKTDKFYCVRFEAKGRPVIPNFVEARELSRVVYQLELPIVGEVENILLKKDSDPAITISSRDDVENILSVLKNTKPTTVSGEIGTPVRVETIINIDFHSKEDVIARLFLYVDKGKYFIEQTDNGVYTISKEDYDSIEKYLPMIIDEQT